MLAHRDGPGEIHGRIVFMKKYLLVVALVFVALVGGGLVFLATWDIPPPTQPMEQVIPNDRFIQ